MDKELVAKVKLEWEANTGHIRIIALRQVMPEKSLVWLNSISTKPFDELPEEVIEKLARTFEIKE